MTERTDAISGVNQRCFNKKNNNYKTYGGRGITVCDRWKGNFEDFLKDMGELYLNHIKVHDKRNTTLERKNVNGNYDPSNCQWATRIEQSNNTRNTKKILYKGKEWTLTGLAKETGVSRSNLRNRLFVFNWTVEKSINEKPYEYKCKLTKDEVEEIRKSELHGAELARQYHVSDATISRIKSDKQYQFNRYRVGSSIDCPHCGRKIFVS